MSAQQNQGAIERRSQAEIVGTYHQPDAITQRLRIASERYHVVSPMSSVGNLPPGHEVAISTVMIDFENESYAQSGKRALLKVALDKIAAAAGVSWSPALCGRTDDGSDSEYYEYRAVAIVKDFDGTERTLVGTKAMDLRSGSPAIAGMSERELQMQRKHIAAHAESKAKNRVLRSLGIRQVYTEKELEKPFAVARLMFTGHSEDPELRAMFARMIGEKALGASSLLYGPPAAALPAASTPRLNAPPPVGTSTDDDDLPEPIAARQPAQPQRAQPAREERPQPAPSQGTREASASGFTIPGGREKGTPIEKASDEALEYWRNRIAGNLDRGESRSESRSERRDRDLVQAMSAEMNRRAQGDDRFDDEELPEHLR